MISFIRGIIEEIREDSVVLECGGIGYDIQIPVSFIETLHIGDRIKIHTYLQVREDAVSLFGFETKEDLEMFRMLIGVSGIGPKGALGILSFISPDDLRFAVLADDAKTIAKAPGIGLKTAKKLILELKDKFDLEDAVSIRENHQKISSAPAENASAQNETVQALAALGYSSAEAMKAVRSVENAEKMTVEELLKAALKKMTFL